MARTWFAIEVELIGARGEIVWPHPGRIFAVGPSHTFEDFAYAINTAFARWDLAHLSEFMLTDGTLIPDPVSEEDFAETMTGPLNHPLDMATTKVARTVQLGEQFRFVFDLGDQWVHECTVHNSKIDPMEELGIRPKTPLSFWGWGDMPDQYGRRWGDDDGESHTPPPPATPHPMLSFEWPTKDLAPPLHLKEVRRAIQDRDADGFAEAIMGKHIDDALQQVAAGAPLLLETRVDHNVTLFIALIHRLNWRGNPGDQELAADLLARFRDEPLPGRAVPVELDMFTDIFEGDQTQMSGGYLDLNTGAAYPSDSADPVAMGEYALDVESDPDRYLWFDRGGGREGWQDMADFARRQSDTQMRERLEQSIRGRGAFRAFRDIIFDTELENQWHIFATDRQYGRARAYLATEDIRAV